MKGEGCWGCFCQSPRRRRDVVKSKFDGVRLVALTGVNTWHNRVP